MLSKIEQEKKVLSQLKPAMLTGGFAYAGQAQGLIFRKSLPEGLAEMVVTIKENAFHTFSRAQLSHQTVEGIILDVGLPNIDLLPYRAGLDNLKTVIDNQHALQYDSDEPVESEEQLNRFIEAIRSYLVNHGFAFVERYRNLHNVLAEMDRLEKGEERWNLKTGILLGDVSAYFRGLIISKLCEDPDFARKQKALDDLLYPKVGPEWIPYYDKLKQELTKL